MTGLGLMPMWPIWLFLGIVAAGIVVLGWALAKISKRGEERRCPMCWGNGWVVDVKPGGSIGELLPCYYPDCKTRPLVLLSVNEGDFDEASFGPDGLVMSVARAALRKGA